MQLFSKDAFAFREQFNNLRKVQNICLCGLFVAAYVALSFMNLKLTPYLEFRFAFLALAAAAAYGGPIMGMSVGIAGDVVSFFAAPQTGPFFPGFTISYAILGFAFGLILYRSKVTPARIFTATFFEFVEACTLNTLWLHFMYGMEWKYLFTIRLVKCIVSLGINTVLLFVFMKAFCKIIASVLTPASVSRS
ncbi:folate family ECF transporter S component [Anaerosacchariphilus sp. NSJ-68]|uniref:Folate family ECF transporter S component n=2 Tax=Lachnospiraceae TaxID=186803 RepID=A0A923LCL6_9FIRM|nr:MULTISPECIES: folate family ECF transporter S component [Lachnospiraceae]MBC5660150.1 folate family ECF transporter S component [Anaerosacchariphilus hominis]MBC5699265.1 folate family ECF transporter S component [Roseburia difficilis]